MQGPGTGHEQTVVCKVGRKEEKGGFMVRGSEVRREVAGMVVAQSARALVDYTSVVPAPTLYTVYFNIMPFIAYFTSRDVPSGWYSRINE